MDRTVVRSSALPHRPTSRQATIIFEMARGWESKSIEAQQAEAAEKTAPSRPRLDVKDAAVRREQETLRLARQSVLRQIEASSNPHHHKMLEAALADLDKKLSKLMEPI